MAPRTPPAMAPTGRSDLLEDLWLDVGEALLAADVACAAAEDGDVEAAVLLGE